MSRNYYSEINLHIVWHTKLSQPLITAQIEPVLHRAIRHKLISLPGVFVHEIGGIETHVHIAVSIVPTVLISDLIGQVKGASAHEINHQFESSRKAIEWQSGYGVVTFGSNHLDWVCNYIRQQREHHAKGTIQERLERWEPQQHAAEAEQREAP